MAAKLDKKRAYGLISGVHQAVYEQDGKMFDGEMNEIEVIETSTANEVTTEAAAPAKKAAKVPAKETAKKEAKPEAPASTPESALDAQLAAQTGA